MLISDTRRSPAPRPAEGWYRPRRVLRGGRVRAHYYRNGRSLCYTWAMVGHEHELSPVAPVQECSRCRLILDGKARV